ncbi:hypothetical protein IFM89_031640 [Coptis chinensis]|uniref:GDSL esterase/lipase n=1 Tax=Coptis chinensis TaxID=261450 RepID=A0A835HA48_9MAGN|nr:hypothetical protein IFM89_031640 [Coptis chinensis]
MENSSAFVASMVISVVIVLGIFYPQAEAHAFFVFGDSLVDSGNNNYLLTIAADAFYPYGIDYPTHRKQTLANTWLASFENRHTFDRHSYENSLYDSWCFDVPSASRYMASPFVHSQR